MMDCVALRFLFWNTRNNIIINSSLVDFIINQQIDYIALAEYAENDWLCDELNSKTSSVYRMIDTLGCRRVRIITRVDRCEPGYYSEYCSSQIINNALIVVAVHLPSKLTSDGIESIKNEAFYIANEIAKMEDELGINNTVLLGDINANPYESPCLAANAFHGIPVYADSRRRTRVVKNREYRMFYNPMWRFYGNGRVPFGTYYLATSEYSCPYWNIYDQVLIRPELKSRFMEDSLKILSRIGDLDLLDNKGHPNKDISDHLPIMFELEGY